MPKRGGSGLSRYDVAFRYSYKSPAPLGAAFAPFCDHLERRDSVASSHESGVLPPVQGGWERTRLVAGRRENGLQPLPTDVPHPRRAPRSSASSDTSAKTLAFQCQPTQEQADKVVQLAI